jgi:hypothetical protein
LAFHVFSFLAAEGLAWEVGPVDATIGPSICLGVGVIPARGAGRAGRIRAMRRQAAGGPRDLGPAGMAATPVKVVVALPPRAPAAAPVRTAVTVSLRTAVRAVGTPAAAPVRAAVAGRARTQRAAAIRLRP